MSYRQFFPSTIALLWVGIVGFPAYAAPTPAKNEAAQYAECTSLVSKNSAAALKLAESWIKKSKALSAYHCKAIALFELKRYTEAAQALDALVRMAAKTKPALLLDITKQDATAWLKAGKPLNAVSSMNYTVGYAQDHNQKQGLGTALLERARLYNKISQPLKALQDLDYALAVNPDDKQALLERAQTFISLKQPTPAQEDVSRILKLEPGNADAASLQRQLKP